MDSMRFSFSDTIAGYVTGYDQDKDTFGLKTTDGRDFQVKFANTYGWIVNNLNEPRTWTGQDQMRGLLVTGRYLFVYGIYYPEHGGFTYEAQFMVFPGRREDNYVFERQDWWIKQVAAIADFYLKAQFQGKPVDYKDYRTTLRLTGEKEADNYRQETDTISRLVYGFASAYMMTGDDRYLEGAERHRIPARPYALL